MLLLYLNVYPLPLFQRESLAKGRLNLGMIRFLILFHANKRKGKTGKNYLLLSVFLPLSSELGELTNSKSMKERSPFS